MKEWLARANAAVGIFGYLGIVAIAGAVIVALILNWVGLPRGNGVFSMFALLAIMPALDAAIALVNSNVIRRFGAIILPSLELAEGVPSNLRTMIVMPTLLTSRIAIAEQVERLLVHHLANSDADLCFALLSDWMDAGTENAPDDGELLAAAAKAIARLNQQYGPAAHGDRFLLLHRRRVWDEAQQSWMGWERKRGKLHELNRLLRGATDTTFVSTDGRPPTAPAGVRYVITLDADTRLPRGAAKRLIGKMAHPLNHPTLDPRAKRVIDGHAVLQPRVSPSMPTGREGSLYQRIFSGASGLDPYAFAVSDVYQDLFGEGSYSGKGIYDVDVFEAALDTRIPPNTLLSHDLFEGTFARAGLVSDIEVVEEFPSRYDVAAARQHRWARGDWQLLPWIFGRRPSSSDGRRLSGIPAIGRWKMIDNLRRSLSAPAAFVALLGGWTLPSASAQIWTGFVLATVATPALIPLFVGVVLHRAGISPRSRVRAIALDLKAASAQIALVVTLLPYQAWLMADAIARTLFRLFVSHRMLLEWITAAQAKVGPRLNLIGFYRQMAGGVALAVAAMILVAWAEPNSWPVATPFLALWLLSPAVALWISLPPAASTGRPVADLDRRFLRLVARRTWRFFDTFVTATDHMLPPDNFQEVPTPTVAHRTSPTNLGLYLLSLVAARDFGWLGTIETVDRLEATLNSMGELERFRGHFYNWYGTLDRRPLEPKYVSTVDSGNLAGHLITLWNACAEMARRPVIGSQWQAGIEDALNLLRQSLSGVGDAETLTRKQLDPALDHFAALLQQPPATPVGIAARLKELARAAAKLAVTVRKLTGEQSKCADTEALIWVDAIGASVLSHQRDLDFMMPWAELIDNDALADSALAPLLAVMPKIADLPNFCEAAISLLTHRPAASADNAALGGTAQPERDALVDSFNRSAQAATSFNDRLAALGAFARKLFDAMAFDFLFDPERELLSIGYRVADGSLDPSYYDLLASEARLASFVAIAKGDIPTRHWFRLGRALAPVSGGSALISWSGSMFEYLMPSLVMRAPAGSLIEQTNQQVVRRQMIYGVQRGVPWGASESAFNARDLELTYQYSSFGIPDLGLKRGLGDDTVIAPYATALAAMVDPRSAARNFTRLAEVGGRGRYGWYEALDYTKTRLPEGTDVAIVRTYMAHHQGMSVIAIADALHDGAMRGRFHAEPIIQATELLLQERMPHDVAIFRAPDRDVERRRRGRRAGVFGAAPIHLPARPHPAHPPALERPIRGDDHRGGFGIQPLAGYCGHAMAGGRHLRRLGHLRFPSRYAQRRRHGRRAINRAAPNADRYEVAFSEGRAEIVRHDGTITTTLEVAVSSEDDAEVRRVSITNLGSQIREIELTSYAEIVLAPHADDDAHPAFSKLFVETEFVADVGAILATRRRRSPGETQALGRASRRRRRRDRRRCAIRDRSGALPRPRTRTFGRRSPWSRDAPLSNTVGAVLDPIFSLRRRVRVPPQATARVAFWTLIAPSREEALDLADKHHEAMAFDRATTLAWTQAQVQLQHLGIGADDAHLFQRLANRVLYSDPTLRPPSETLKRGGGAASTALATGNLRRPADRPGPHR